MSFHKILLALFLLLNASGCASLYKTQVKSFEKDKTYRFAFYNVENLFDLVDDPKTDDEEFTPDGKNKWTEERYLKKLNQIAQVVGDMNYPAVVGFCELENETVLKDLVEKTKLKEYRYKYVHYDSPDARGIDNGLIYMDGVFSVTNSDVTRIDYPKEIAENQTTRDILHVEGVFRGRDTMHFFVNHWPSRRGGEKESQPRRVFVATQLRKNTNKLLSENPNARIVITGDFNDEPNDESLLSVLDARPTCDKVENNQLYNCSYQLKIEGKGSYNYQGEWNMLDQFIVSGSLLTTTSNITVTTAQIFQAEYLIHQDKKYGPTPNRTYGGTKYYGGYSDHFPVFVEVKVGR